MQHNKDINAKQIVGGIVGLAFCVAGASEIENNWHQWRGPYANGVAPKADPPVVWSETNNIKWKIKIEGSGVSTPIIWGNKVFIQTAVPTGRRADASSTESAGVTAEQDGGVQNPERRQARPGGGGGGRMGGQKPTEFYAFKLLCIDRQTGKMVWGKTAREEIPHQGHHPDGSFASSSPTTDGEHIYAYFGSRGLYCYDMDGNLKWSQDFGDMQVVMGFGEGSSPALCDELVIVNWDHEGDSFIFALDKKSGEIKWKMARDERTSWSTPLVVEYNGKKQIVVSATGKVRSYEPASGKVIWECAGLTRNVIPSPVADEDTVYVMSGYQGNSALAIKLGREGDLTGSDAIKWSLKRNTPYVPSPLLYQGRIYFFSRNDAILSCYAAKSGRVLIDGQRLEQLQGVYASPIGAAGRVYITGRNGATVVLKASDQLDIIATNKLDDRIDASPAAVGKELFLRGRQYLYWIAEN